MESDFLTLLEQNHGRIDRICRYYTFSTAARQDLYQEICYQLWRSYQRFRGEALPGTWLYRVAVNTAITYTRKDVKTKTQGLEASQFQLQDPQNPAGQLEQQERIDQLYKAVSQLKQADQTLVLLYLEELSYREIAEVTGLSENNVGVKISRIKKQLAKLLTNSTS